ncbi:MULTISPECIES: TetR/AcrR family transcriptional regulator [unclassified Streptomyces]|uniref:TetR/AcrR family transcriptional regulator n=1 Tax=unclassified Streptomyces TaxID=2593676 RepID=UPI001CBAE256|nr:MULTISPECIES: TetR/AcrR family transcriptional regulator [unclassified Streptomyces]WPO76662.1 TetR/AcrR family transcriptional regulator [Streptomyces sp. KN37]
MTSSPARNRRADARRSRAAILDAATRVLNAEPDASLETIASAAGVTRPTVYAHFPSREQLLLAVVERITEEAVAAMDAADLGTGPAADALMRMLDAAAQVTGRYPVLLQVISAHPVSSQADYDRHTPVADRIRRVIQRGRQTGDFDNRLPVDWLVAATIRLGHAASEEQDTGRLSAPAAQDALRVSLLRMLGATAQADFSPRLR